MPYKIITPPTDEQISLVQAREHLLIYFDGDSPGDYPDDAWLSGVGIPAARQYCEEWLKRAIAPQVIELALDAFPGARLNGGRGATALDYATYNYPSADSVIELPMAPVTALTTVKYLDGDGVERTMDAAGYTFDDYSAPPRVVLAANTAWPTTKVAANAVKVRYTAGYDLPADSPQTNPLPHPIRAAMLLVLSDLFEHRGMTMERQAYELPLGVCSLLRPYQLRLSMA